MTMEEGSVDVVTSENQHAVTYGVNSSDVNNSGLITSVDARTEEYIPVYDYFDINDRITWMLNTPQQISPLVIGTVAIAANTLCLVAVLRVRSRWTNLHHFMFSLMLSDILLCISVMAHIINWLVNPLYQSGNGPWNERLKSRCAFIIIKSLNTMGLNITLLNLAGMAFDHYIAILMPFRYGTILNIRRSRRIIIILWLIALATALSDFASPLWDKTPRKHPNTSFNYCELVWLSPYHEEYTTFVIAPVCFCVMLTIYLKIYFTVRMKHSKRGMYQTSNGRIVREKMKHNTRALLTTLLILGTFTLFWLPMWIFQIVMLILLRLDVQLSAKQFSNLSTADQWLISAFLINSLCDPVIYAVRISEIRHGIVLLLVNILPTRLREKIARKAHEHEVRNSSNYSISLLSERRSTQVSAIEDGTGDVTDDKEQLNVGSTQNVKNAGVTDGCDEHADHDVVNSS